MLNHLKSEANIAYTENGAVTNASTMSDCLDLFAAIGALRAADDQEIIRRFVRAYAEDADIAMKILFFGRDVRGGLGERRVFRVIINWLAENRAESLRKNIELMRGTSPHGNKSLLFPFQTPCRTESSKTIAPVYICLQIKLYNFSKTWSRTQKSLKIWRGFGAMDRLLC